MADLKRKAQGKTFTFPEGTSETQISQAIDEYFGKAEAQPIELQQEQALPAGTEAVGIKEAALSIASQGPAYIGGGLVGIPVQLAESLGLVEQGTAAKVVGDVTEGLTREPKTVAGQQKLQQFGEGVKNVSELPVIEQVIEGAQYVSDLRKDVTGGIAEAGAPATGAIMEGVIGGIPEMVGVATGGLATKKGLEAIPQSKRKQSISRRLIEGTGDTDTSIYKPLPFDAEDVPKIVSGEKRPPRVQLDPIANDAIKQGFDEGDVATFKASSPQTKRKMLKMTNILKKGKSNKKFALTNRPSDVAGDSMLERIKVIRSANQRAGKQIDAEASKLKGKQVDFNPAIDSFKSNLKDLGIKLDTSKGKITLDFSGSDIEGLADVENLVARLVKRMATGKAPDAYDVHRMKRFIDQQVTYGKLKEGLSGRIDTVIKDLRRDLDSVLDNNFPAYDKVNTEYAETVNALNKLQKASGSSLDLSSDYVAQYLGTDLRGLMSNRKSRTKLLETVEEIDVIAKKHGYKLDDDLLEQVMFAQALDSRFKTGAETSFQGQIIEAQKQAAMDMTGSKKGLTEIALDTATGAYRAARGISDDTAMTSIEKLLRER